LLDKTYTQPCRLTSPHEVSKRVKDLQWILQGHNRFVGLAPFKDGKIDGEFGPLTAQAARSAKRWLGYPAAAQSNIYGQTLHEYLRESDWRPLPDTYRERRDALLKAYEQKRLPGMKAFELAKTQVGYHETPQGSNRSKYGEWYGFNGVPWCDIFVSYCLHHTGWTKTKWSYVGDNYADALAHRYGTFVVMSPKPGDLCLFSPHRHISFFDRWINEGAGIFQDLGGNTSDGVGWSNGGEVAYTRRRRTEVEAFVRITP
jgi:hypothetical protein